MEVIPINTNNHTISKSDLWSEQIQSFQKSGLSRKDWCQQNEVPQSTFGYWLRKIRTETSEIQGSLDPVFVKLPSKQELQDNTGAGNHPVTILLPEKIRIEVDADHYCPDCHTKYKVVTKETVKRLKFIPARFEVVEEATFVYSCPKCGAMKRPEKAPSLLKGSVATPSLVAGIMNAKYVNGMPLARQEREFARYDLDLSTKTMANWIIQCAERYLQPLYNLMKEELLRSSCLHGDETRIQVIDEPDQKGSTQNWMWVYLTDGYSGSSRMVLFQYERTRAGYHPAELKETTAYQAMARIGMLYKIEEMIRDRSPEERYEERQKQAKPLLEAFFGWLHTLEDSVDRSSLIGEAVLYTLNQETYLKRYLEEGHLSIDNLAAERALKNFATGRRNWLFAKSIRGAQASATVYSITETAMLNGLKPYHYLTYVMEKMKDLGPFPEKAAMLELLPWSNSLPTDCRSNIKK